MPEFDDEDLPSARKLISSRGQSRGGRDEERSRPVTADLLGSLTRQAAAGHERFSIETVENLSERFREILNLEERDLLDQIDFLHSCIEAERERDHKNMCADVLPTERDLKDLRDRLQVELSITAAESRKQMRSKPLVPLARSLKAPKDLPAPPAPPFSHDGLTPPCLPPVGRGQDISVAAVPGIPRAELGIDSDEERFLFGDESEEEEEAKPAGRAGEEEGRRNVDILVLDHDEEQAAEATGNSSAQEQQHPYQSRFKGNVVAGEGAVFGGTSWREEEDVSRRGSVRSRHRRLIEDARANAALVSSMSSGGGDDGGGEGHWGAGERGRGRRGSDAGGGGGGNAPTPPKVARPSERMRPAYARPSTMTKKETRLSEATSGRERGREEVDTVTRFG